MDNMESFPVVECLRSSDPREYIEGEMFLKTVSSLDPCSSSPWNEVRRVSFNRLLSQNDEAVVVTGITSSETGGKLIIFSTYKENGFSKTFHDLSPAKTQGIADVIKIAAIHLPNEQRCAFVRTLGEKEDIFQQADTATVLEICYTELLNSIPDTNDKVSPELSIVGSRGEEPEDKQKKQLERFLTVVSGKLSQEQMEALVKEFEKYSSRVDNLFSTNYHHCFHDIFRFALPRIEGFIEDFASSEIKRLAKVFPVKDLVTNPIETEEALSEAIKNISVNLTFDTRNATITEEGIEFVDLAKVIAGSSGNSFLDGSGSRGNPDYLFNMCQALQAGEMDICGGTPIEVYEHKGDYFVGNDGNHRAVVLKALGVAFVPMMVIHAEGVAVGIV